MVKLISEKQKNSPFPKKKSLVRLTPGRNIHPRNSSSRHTDGQKESNRAKKKSDKFKSISPTFYNQLFCIKVFCAPFLCLQFGFVFFWQKEISAKATDRLLVKLTKEVNFTNILQPAFLYKIVLCIFSVLTVWVYDFLA